MARFDLQSVVVFGVALAAALATGHGINRLGHTGEARAMPVTAPVAASAPATTPGAAAQVSRSADGHYWAEADINGHAVRVLVDTGASVVALTRDDALRLGFRLGPDDFTRRVMTASGETRAATVELTHVSIAGARVEQVQALVIEQGLHASLLGMSYLGRLSRFEATPHGLTLRP